MFTTRRKNKNQFANHDDHEHGDYDYDYDCDESDHLGPLQAVSNHSQNDGNTSSCLSIDQLEEEDDDNESVSISSIISSCDEEEENSDRNNNKQSKKDRKTRRYLSPYGFRDIDFPGRRSSSCFLGQKHQEDGKKGKDLRRQEHGEKQQ